MSDKHYLLGAIYVVLPLPVFNLVAAVIYFVINRKAFRFVAFHSLQSNLALIVWLICILVTDLLFPMAFFIYLIFMILVNLLYIVISIVALLKAGKGRFYYMPLFGRFSFERYYRSKAAPLENPIPPNKPPGVI